MKPIRIEFNLSAANYRKADGISKSAMDLFAECPAKFRANELGLMQREESAAMQYGTLLHSLILDGKAAFYIKPDGLTFASKDGKAWRDEHQDKPIIPQDTANELTAIASAVTKHRHAAKLIAGAQTEVSLFGVDRETGLAIKGRADILSNTHVADLKTIRSADNATCSRSLAEYNYHRQAAMYLELARQNGFESDGFYFIFIEKGAFPLINVRRISPEAVELGAIENGRILRDIKKARETGIWLDYSGDSEQPGEINLPTWKYTDTTGCELLNVPEAKAETAGDLIP